MSNTHHLPKDPGSYALLIALSAAHAVRVRRLGVCNFLPGIYLYLGSARGAGGIKARLGRHLLGGGHTHWHIDYLRAVGHVTAFCYLLDRVDQIHLINVECAWSQSLAVLPGVSIPIAGFGASDCRAGCSAHLLAVPDYFCSIDNYRKNLAEEVGSQPQDIICCEIYFS